MGRYYFARRCRGTSRACWVIRPTPLGRRAQLQVRGLSSPSRAHLDWMPAAAALSRPMAVYEQLVEVLA